jgi:putative endonuclease
MIDFFVYAITSLNSNYIYVGLTNNPDRRFQQHNRGKGRATKPNAPFRMLYLEKVGPRDQARKREKYLKSGIGKEFLKSLVLKHQ